MLRDRIVDQRGVLHALGQRPNLVEAGGVGDEPEARNGAVGRFQSHNAAEAGGLADGAAGIGAEPEHGEIPRDRGRGPSAAAARHALRVVGILRPAETGGFTGRTHGEFIHIRFAEEDRALLFEDAPDRRVINRDIALQNLGAAGGFDALGGKVVLQRHRNPGKRGQLFLRREFAVDFRRRLQRGFRCKFYIGV